MYQFNKKRLKVLLAENGITQQELAVQMNMGNASLSKRLNGKYQFRMDEIFVMSEVLNCDPNIFFTPTVAKTETR
jgi:transcriptional regulator with XRE-family HTH domain